MADEAYEGPTPGDPSILSAEQHDLVNRLYELRGRLKAITPDEQVILEAAIMLLLEYLSEYAEGTPAEDWLDLPPDEIKARVTKRRTEGQSAS
jgi:hypothetical protein